jgi:hypothetical protein
MDSLRKGENTSLQKTTKDSGATTKESQTYGLPFYTTTDRVKSKER